MQWLLSIPEAKQTMANIGAGTIVVIIMGSIVGFVILICVVGGVSILEKKNSDDPIIKVQLDNVERMVRVGPSKKKRIKTSI
jgi:hypothetical protein